MPYLPAVELEWPKGLTVTASVIWLHGLGADGNDFAPIVPQLNLPAGVGARFIFPHAPSIPVTINNGYVMPAWYDIKSMDGGRHVDTEQIEQSAGWVHDLIEREIERGVAPDRIVIAGFSQGGATATRWTCQGISKIDNLILWAAVYPPDLNFEAHSQTLNSLNFRIVIGDDDEFISESELLEHTNLLDEKGINYEIIRYNGTHKINSDTLSSLNQAL